MLQCIEHVRPATGARSALQTFDANPTVLHLAAVALEPDWTGGRDLQLAFQRFPVAGRFCDPVLHGDHQLIPVLGLVLLQSGEGPRQRVVAALPLRTADVHAAVGVWRRTE